MNLKLKKCLFICLFTVIIVLVIQYKIEDDLPKTDTININININNNKDNNNNNFDDTSTAKFVNIEKSTNTGIQVSISSGAANNNNNNNNNRNNGGRKIYKRKYIDEDEDEYEDIYTEFRKNGRKGRRNGGSNGIVNPLTPTFYQEYLNEKQWINQENDDQYASLNKQPTLYSTAENGNWKSNASLNQNLLAKPFIFIHIPKTGGTSLRESFESNIEHGKLYVKLSPPSHEQAEQVAKRGIDAMFGHFIFGLHYFFDNFGEMNQSIGEDHQNPYSYLTMLRDPVERVISHYYFLKDSPNHPLYGEVASNTLEDWLHFSVLARDEQCRRVVGIPRQQYKLPDDFKEQCIFKLKHTFKYVGITERFDDSLVLLSHKTGFNDMKFVAKNVGAKHSKYSDTPQHIIEKIQQLNQNDIAAYEIGKIIFEKEIDSMGREYFEKEKKLLMDNYNLNKKKNWPNIN